MAKSGSKLFGPAMLVTAAFIGPGTVVITSKAGAIYGCSLLWAVLFSVFACIVLQEMAGRLGIVTGEGLSHAIKSSFSNPLLRFLILGLVILAILVGNAAYQTGNILGAAKGISIIGSQAKSETEETEKSSVGVAENQAAGNQVAKSQVSPAMNVSTWVYIIGGIAAVLILIGKFEVLQKVLTVLVIAMSVLFLLSALMSGPDMGQIASGLIPRIPPGSEWFVIGIIGTTVVPYNLFLHASATAQRWPPLDVKKTHDKERAVKESKRDTTYSILIGGLVTTAIMVTASNAFHENVTEFEGIGSVALQLEPAMGSWANWLLGAGLFAAGLTSAITAPVAAAYAAAGCLGWPSQLSDYRLKLVALIVVAIGVGAGIYMKRSPTEVIILAQVANGLLLPIIAIFLLITLNRVRLVHRFRNSTTNNILGAIVLIVVSLIAARQFNSVRDKIEKMRNPAPAATTELLNVDGTELQSTTRSHRADVTAGPKRLCDNTALIQQRFE